MPYSQCLDARHILIPGSKNRNPVSLLFESCNQATAEIKDIPGGIGRNKDVHGNSERSSMISKAPRCPSRSGCDESTGTFR